MLGTLVPSVRRFQEAPCLEGLWGHLSMCERFTLRSAWSDIQKIYRLPDTTSIDYEATDRFDCAPVGDVLFVTAGEQGASVLREGGWGLVPWKAREVPKQVIFNARIEIVDTSSTFKDAWASKRCLVPVNGFYEVGKDGESWFIHKPGDQPFSLAGLWAHNSRLGITSCALITIPATEPLGQLCTTQPAILSAEAYEAWLDPRTPANDLKLLLSDKLDNNLEFHRVNWAPDPIAVRRPVAADDRNVSAIQKPRPVEGKSRPVSRPHDSPSEGPNEILIDRRDPILARRSEIVKLCCQHEGCENVAFWGYSQGGQGPRQWFCNEHRADGEAILGRQQPKRPMALNHIR